MAKKTRLPRLSAAEKEELRREFFATSDVLMAEARAQFAGKRGVDIKGDIACAFSLALSRRYKEPETLAKLRAALADEMRAFVATCDMEALEDMESDHAAVVLVGTDIALRKKAPAAPHKKATTPTPPVKSPTTPPVESLAPVA